MLQFLSTPKESRFRIRKKRSQKNRDVNEDSESGSLITSTVISVADHDKTRKWVSPQWEKEDCLCDHDNVTWGKKRQRRNRNPKSATTLQVQPNCTHVGTNGPPVPSCGVNKRSLKPLKLKRNNSTIPSTTIPQLKKVQSKGFDSKQAETALMQSCSKECVYVRGLTKEGNSEKENSTVAPPNLQASTLCTQSQHHQTISHDKSRKTKNILCEVSNEVTVERMPSEDLFKKPKSLFCDITLFSQTEVVSHKNESIRHHITLNHTFQPALTSSPLDPSKSGPITDRIIPVPPNAAARGTVIKECSTDSVYVGNERPVDGLLSDDSASNQLNVIDYKSDSSNLNGNFDLSKSFSSLQITLDPSDAVLAPETPLVDGEYTSVRKNKRPL